MKKFKTLLLLLSITAISYSQIIAPKGTHSIENTLQSLELNCSIENAYLIAYRTAAELNWVIKTSDSKIYAFTAETPQIMKRWGDNVNVYFDIIDNNKSTISVKSTLGHKPNKEYITQFLILIENKIIKK